LMDPLLATVIGVGAVVVFFTVEAIREWWRWRADEKWFRECERVQRAWEDRER